MRTAAGVRAGVLVAVTALVVLLLVSARRPAGVSGPPAPVAGAAQALLPGGLVEAHTYTQELGPLQDGLSELALYAESGDQRTPAPLALALTDGAQKILEAGTDPRSAAEVARFRFAPIAGSSHRHLVAHVRLRGTRGPVVASLFVVPNAPAAVPHLMDNGRDTGAFAPMRLRYGPPIALRDQLPAISDRASQYHPGPFKTPAPLLATAVGLLSALGLVVAVSGASPGKRPRRRTEQ